MDRLINWSINGQKKRTKGHIGNAEYTRTHWVTDLSPETWRPLSADTTLRTGCVYFKYKKLILTYWSIDRSIDQFINGQTKWTEGHISRKSGSSTHNPTDLSTETQRRLLTDTNRRTGPQLIDLSTDGRNGRRDTSVGQQTAVNICRLIYQRRRGGCIYVLIQQRIDSCVPLRRVP